MRGQLNNSSVCSYAISPGVTALYLSLHPYLGRTSRDGNPASRELLPHVLKSFVSKFGRGFSIFADCGAGIGDTTVEYNKIIPPGGRVFTYEPLPENLRVLEK